MKHIDIDHGPTIIPTPSGYPRAALSQGDTYEDVHIHIICDGEKLEAI